MPNKNKTKYKVCRKCCRECKAGVDVCDCGSEKFEPDFVKRKAPINRQFSVQVTEIAKEFKTKDGPSMRITLSKWWPGNNSTLHINKPEEWDKIKNIVDKDLGPFLGWKTKQEILKKTDSKTAKQLSQDYPDFVNEIINGIDFKKIKEEELPQVTNAITALVGALQNADESFVIATKKLIQQLPKQGKKAIEDLSDLLKQWSLRQVTAISSEVKHRIETIEIFNKAILDDKTYEIRGDGSVHRILENAMWIIDERYWLLHSNETMRTIIGDELKNKDKKFENKRPDFVCGTVGNKMIIAELKRPSHELKKEDLEQLETYMLIISKNSGQKYNFEGYLIGKKISNDLKERMQFRGKQFKIKTYSDLIDDVKKRYNDYYKNLK